MMVSTALIMGAGLIIGIGIAAVFWNNMISYLKRAISKIEEVIRASVAGVQAFLRKSTDGIMQTTKAYSQNIETKKWRETIVHKTIKEQEVPTEMKKRMRLNEEFNITPELENALKSAS